MNNIIPIAMMTHNRTRIACYTLNKFLKNIKSKYKIKIIISDDKSTDKNHIKSLLYVAYLNKLKDIIFLHTTNARYGLGASMNNALRESWKYSNKCLTLEDDRLLQRELNLDEAIDIINNDSTVMGIRFGSYGTAFGKDIMQKKIYNNHFSYIYGTQKNVFIYNNQVMLRSKRFFDIAGYYNETLKTVYSEVDMKDKYNSLSNTGNNTQYKILVPSILPYYINDDPNNYFIHIGKSTYGARFSYPLPPSRLNWLYEKQTELSPDYNLKLPDDFNLTDIMDLNKSFRKDENDTIKEYICFK